MARGWAGIAAEYDRSFARLCAGAIEPLLDALGAPEGPARLLDAGTGTGIAAAAAFERGWTVTAADAEVDMTAFTAVRVPDADVITASIADLPVGDGTFEAIAANFSINHADHPDRVATELHRVAAPGASIAATIWPWQRTEMNALWSAIMDATGTRPEHVEIPAGEPFERSEAGLSLLLERGGFRDPTARRVDWTFVIAPDDLWAGVTAGLATLGQAYTSTDGVGRERIRAEYERRTADLAIDGLLRFTVEAILAVATA